MICKIENARFNPKFVMGYIFKPADLYTGGYLHIYLNGGVLIEVPSSNKDILKKMDSLMKKGMNHD